MHYSQALESLVFEIYPLLKRQEHADTATRLGFLVDHLDDIIQRLKQAGHLVDQPARNTPWGYQAVVLDTDGRKVELTERPNYHL